MGQLKNKVSEREILCINIQMTAQFQIYYSKSKLLQSITSTHVNISMLNAQVI